MLRLLLSSALLTSAAYGQQSQKDTEEAVFVQGVLRTSPDKLSQAQINRFLYRIPPSKLPSELQGAYFQKRDAIMGAGLHRKFQVDEEPQAKKAVKPANPNTAKALLAAGYEEIDTAELNWLSRETKCNQAQLEEHSTLKIVIELGRDKKKSLRYFLQPKDPFFAAVANYRKGHKDIRGSRVFGTKSYSFCGGKP
jgi:hypothetical protein